MKQTTEKIDSIPCDVLIHVIRHSNDFTWNFLAIKIMLTRLNLKLVMYQNKETVLQECCIELQNLLKNSINIPNSQADLKQILNINLSVNDTANVISC